MVDETPKNPAAVELGRLGGIARAKKLTKAQRQAISRKGGAVRRKQFAALRKKKKQKVVLDKSLENLLE